MTFYGPLPLSAIEQKQPFICKSFLIFGDFAPKCSDPPFCLFVGILIFHCREKFFIYLIFFCGLLILSPESIPREEELFENRTSGYQGRQSTEAAFTTHIQPSWVQISVLPKIITNTCFRAQLQEKVASGYIRDQCCNHQI